MNDETHILIIGDPAKELIEAIERLRIAYTVLGDAARSSGISLKSLADQMERVALMENNTYESIRVSRADK